ncbi:GIY-YIG nuclease family protein, partial [Enterococcus faecium]|uniref:GIY-YIG nuclease family protein n=1 Tax=Enterococcus faecium TaxID=1352 RepID=UPI00292DAB40
IKELSSASVPFEFDVHAMIFSEDAPSLETKLHNHFRKQEVNKYSTTRDPLNIAGYVAINQMTNIVETIKASDIPENDLKEAFFL